MVPHKYLYIYISKIINQPSLVGGLLEPVYSIEQTVLSKSCNNKDQQHAIPFRGVEEFILAILTLIYFCSRSVDKILNRLVVAGLGMDFPKTWYFGKKSQNSATLLAGVSRLLKHHKNSIQSPPWNLEKPESTKSRGSSHQKKEMHLLSFNKFSDWYPS